MKYLWNLKSSVYHRIRLIPGIRWVIDQESGHLRNLLPDTIHQQSFILDVGSGAGTSLDIFPDDIPVVAVDHSFSMVKQAGRRRGRLYGIVADARALPIKSGTVPFCSCIGVSEYISSVRNMLKEFSRVLLPEGLLLITSARKNLLNRIRYLLGHRLFLFPKQAWDQWLGTAGFRLAGQRRSMLQYQYFAEKRGQ